MALIRVPKPLTLNRNLLLLEVATLSSAPGASWRSRCLHQPASIRRCGKGFGGRGWVGSDVGFGGFRIQDIGVVCELRANTRNFALVLA